MSAQTTEQTVVYAGKHYGRPHRVIAREGRRVRVCDPDGLVFPVHKCDTDLVTELSSQKEAL